LTIFDNINRAGLKNFHEHSSNDKVKRTYITDTDRASV